MGKGGSAKMQVAEYRMSIHFGICNGPVDHVAGLYIGEKEMWSGKLDVPGSVIIDRDDLFGGIKKEGGVRGTVTYLPGDDTQVMPEYIAQKYGRTSATMWGYRGIASIFFHEHMNVGGSRLGTPASAAFGFITFSANPAVDDTVTIDGTVYVFKPDEEVTAANHVQIGGSVGQTILNLASAINGSSLGLDQFLPVWFGSRAPNRTCYAEADAPNNRVRVIARLPGAAGNTLTLAVSGANLGRSGPTLTGGWGGGTGTWIDQWLSTVISSIGDRGFYLGANNPYLKTMWAKVARAARGLDTRYEKIWRTDEEFDCNPAHIIFECLFNRVWGMGAPLSAIDVRSFEKAAKALYEEAFGLSLMWSRSSSIEDFVTEVLDHIEATLFINPRTGLLTLRLIRGDYDIESLRVFDPKNSTVENFSRKYWGETINEIVVTWTNPENEQEETVAAQDLANIAMQGGIVSDGRNYYGVRSGDLAMGLAQRDLRAASYPIATCDLVVNREAWDLLPGDVCKIVSPDDNITEIIMRVGPVDYGKPGETEIKVSLAEDVFALATAEYSTPPGSEWEDGSEDPLPAAFRYFFTMPYFLTQQQVLSSTLESAAYPTVFGAALAGQTGGDTAFYELHSVVVDTVGNPTQQQIGTYSIVSRAVVAAGLPHEHTTVVSGFSGRTQGSGPVAGSFVIIGGLPGRGEDAVEIAAIKAVDESGYELMRGVLDTVPREWPENTPVWFLAAGQQVADQTPRAATEDVDYWVLPKTSKGTLPISQAPLDVLPLTERPWLPTRPANVWINGGAFEPVVDCEGLDLIPVTWATRNRLLEDSQVLPWWEDSVAPEAGQTTRIEVYDLDDNLMEVHDGLAGESFDIPLSSFQGKPFGRLVVKAERDGLISLQGYSQVVKVNSGYGYAYGYNYGGYNG